MSNGVFNYSRQNNWRTVLRKFLPEGIQITIQKHHIKAIAAI